MKRFANNDRCSESDFREAFVTSTEELRWLSYTFTGDDELGDKILAAALEQSVKGAGQVFREWMLSWARRWVIKVCIEIVQPWKSSLAQMAYKLYPMRLDAIDASHLACVVNLPPEVLQQKLLRLDVLSRFVFVLRALQGYMRRETALLLNIDDRACEWVYLRAASALYSDIELAESSWKQEPEQYAEYCLAQAGD